MAESQLVKRRHAVLLVLIAISSVANGATRSATVPRQFRGDWGYPGVPCKTEVALRIDGKILWFDEYHGEALQVIRRSSRAISASLAFSGEGHEWSGDVTLTLSRSGNELVIRPERDSSRYIRCKKR
jgi:hypothetical protein